MEGGLLDGDTGGVTIGGTGVGVTGFGGGDAGVVVTLGGTTV